MGRKKHVVDLFDEERRTLEWFISIDERKAEDITRARILLKADDGLTDVEICEYLGCSIGTSLMHAKTTASEGLRRFIVANPTVSTNANSRRC